MLVCITFLSRYNLFIQHNVLLQPVANPTGILHCTMCHPCSLCYFAMGFSAPQTRPVRGTGQQLFSKQRAYVKTMEEICKDGVGSMQVSLSRFIVHKFALWRNWVDLPCFHFFFIGPPSQSLPSFNLHWSLRRS